MSRHSFDQQFPQPLLGIDEVGVGCIAGPLTACGVILPEDKTIIRGLEELNTRDSKQLSARLRERIYDFLLEQGVWYFIAEIPAPKLKKNLNPFLDDLFRQIIREAERGPGYALTLVDGSQGRDLGIPRKKFRTIAKADDQSLAVGCASIIAKVHRDAQMVALHDEYPHYGWDTNKGYPTEKHINGLYRHGPVEHLHRMEMKPVKKAIAARHEHPEGAPTEPFDVVDRRGPSGRAGLRRQIGTGRFR